MKKVIEKVVQGKKYVELAVSLLESVSKNRVLDHPFLTPNADKKNLVIIIASNKGLCGSYNSAIERNLLRAVHHRSLREGDQAIVIGKYAERAARKANLDIVATFNDWPDVPTQEEVSMVVSLAADAYLDEERSIRRVFLLSTTFESPLKTFPELNQFLPITEDLAKNLLHDIHRLEDVLAETEEIDDPTDQIFEPDEEELLDYALTALLEAYLYHALLEALASEHSLRRVAMKNATDNADSLVEKVSLEYNRTRQRAITTEISEISAGVEAMNTSG